MDGRAVAVKRLLRQFYDLAKKEIEVSTRLERDHGERRTSQVVQRFILLLSLCVQVLIMSDEHPNVVRCFAMEEDREFVYLALEKCRRQGGKFF